MSRRVRIVGRRPPAATTTTTIAHHRFRAASDVLLPWRGQETIEYPLQRVSPCAMCVRWKGGSALEINDGGGAATQEEAERRRPLIATIVRCVRLHGRHDDAAPAASSVSLICWDQNKVARVRQTRNKRRARAAAPRTTTRRLHRCSSISPCCGGRAAAAVARRCGD